MCIVSFKIQIYERERRGVVYGDQEFVAIKEGGSIMNIVASIIPLERIKVYNGATKEGKEYSIGTWKVQGVLDGKVFAVTAFTETDTILSQNVNISVDCVIDIYGKAWQDKFFNEIMVSKVMNKEVVHDVPSALPEERTPMMDAASMGIKLDGDLLNDLPF